jgi:hypothetical protein
VQNIIYVIHSLNKLPICEGKIVSLVEVSQAALDPDYSGRFIVPNFNTSAAI